MDMTQCKHLKIIDYSGYDIDLEKFIKILENQYKFDFKSLPEWKKLIGLMNLSQTQYKQRLRDAAKREFKIIENLHKEYSRISPFELTDRLARTARKWEILNSNLRRRKVTKKDQGILVLEHEPKNEVEYSPEQSDVQSTPHPNTEVIQSLDVIASKPDADSDLKSISSPKLPISICTNIHKKLSAFGSKYSALSNLDKPFGSTTKSVSTKDDIVCWEEIKGIQVNPNELKLKGNENVKRMKLSLTNCSTEYLYLRFKEVLNSTYFKFFKIIPATPVKLYPGLTITYKLIFKVKKHLATTFKSALCFKIGSNVLLNQKEDKLFQVPISHETIEHNIITVTQTVSIPPAYTWHVTTKCGYPRGVGSVYVNDDNVYYMHVRKRDVTYDTESNLESLEVISPNSESLVQRQEDIEEDVQNEALLNQTKTSFFDAPMNTEDVIINTEDTITPLLDDIIDQAFQPFVFKHIYLRLLPKCKRIFQIFFTKPDHVGCHNAYYDLEFYNSTTDEIIMIKTIKVFAEVLPNPITINPHILDMSQSPITLGFCRDYFTIVNSHKTHPVIIKIKTTIKMQKMFKITPMESLIPGKASVDFEVSLCLKDENSEGDSDELSYFTIKIMIYGDKSIYSNSPPMFYEIVTPCAKEFKRIYGDKDYLLTNFHVWVSEYIISSSDCQTGLTIDYKSAKMRLRDMQIQTEPNHDLVTV